MKKVIYTAYIAILLAAMPVFGKDKDKPVVGDKLKSQIFQEQRDLANLQVEFANLQQQIQQVQKEYGDDTKALQDLITQAKTGVDEKQWTLDLQKLEFSETPVPEPAKEDKK